MVMCRPANAALPIRAGAALQIGHSALSRGPAAWWSRRDTWCVIDALDLARVAANESRSVVEIRMAMVCGSVARGLADENSDVDLYLYGDHVDGSLISRTRPLESAGAELVFGVPTSTGWFQKYRLDGRFIDLEFADVRVLDDAARDLEAGRMSPQLVRLAAGARDAIPVIGQAELERHNRRLQYSDAAALNEVRVRTGGLLPVSALFSLTYSRGDLLSYASRVSRVLLDAVALLAAANREFVPVDEPKWMRWHLARLARQPDRFADLTNEVFRSPTLELADEADRMLLQVLDLVDASVPNADTRNARFALELRSRT
jgi:predicted nucleotidyltransferase